MAYHPRTLSAAVARAARTFPVVLVTGPRQSGKTTLLRTEYGRSHRLLSFEAPDVRERALGDPAGFLRENPGPAILDEIQYVPELLSYLKVAVDEKRRPGHWLLTGSRQFALMERVAQSLAGRTAVLSLLPLSLGEATDRSRAKAGIGSLLAALHASPGRIDRAGFGVAEWILGGSYPEPRSDARVDRALWYGAYVQTYLERDVRQVVNVGDLGAFHRFVRLCAARTGQLLNMSDLARDVGLSVPSVKRWLSVLEAGGIIHLLPPYHANFGKRLVKAPKLYFLDAGLAAYLLGIRTAETLLHGPSAGALFETAVVAEWIKLYRHRGEAPALFFWRSRDGLEVDLLAEWDGTLHPIEIKATATILPGHAAGLLKWREVSGVKTEGLIFAPVEAATTVAAGVRALPWDWT